MLEEVNQQEGRGKLRQNCQKIRKLECSQAILLYKYKEKDPPHGGHDILPIQTIFELNCRIQVTNLLIKFHEYWAKMCILDCSHVFTIYIKLYIDKTAPPPGGHAKNVTSRVKKTHPTPWRPCFLPIRTIFELNRVNKTHVLTRFHEDWTKNVTSRVFTCFQYIHIEKTDLPPGAHVFSPIWTNFELVRDIDETNILTKFHDWAKIVTSRVFTMKTAPPPGGHLYENWASNVTSTVFTSFELSRDINGTNVLTKFHEDLTINVASRVFTTQNVDAARQTKGDHKSSP
ncbi:hypothetical protein DPMN_025543 [Dreissena polymorpha]|uniref:Uncharacterized protein n=1 Tax=Dreissena polymorpha TaxID=45954 RepID=A0A9D4RBY2_DREPO|nr:hypothetical protein DPMN_025543 [Dreissena polymorpha]